MKNQAGYRIRPAGEADLPRLMVLYRQLSEQGAMPETAPRPVEEAQVEALRRLQREPDSVCLVLEGADGMLAGSLTFYLLPNLSHGALPIAMVENVVVDDALRGRGLGRLLMDEAERRAIAHGCYKLALTSNNNRPAAHAFYEALGYQRSNQGMTKYFARRVA